MIKEYSIDFNEQKIMFKMYKDHVGDQSYPFQELTFKDNQTGNPIPLSDMQRLFMWHKKHYENMVMNENDQFL